MRFVRLFMWRCSFFWRLLAPFACAAPPSNHHKSCNHNTHFESTAHLIYLSSSRPAGCRIASHRPLVVPLSCPLFALACCHIASPRPLIAPYSLPLVAPAGCCVASQRAALSLSHCLVVPPSRCLVAPASCCIISCHPLLLELMSSEPLTLDEEVRLQREEVHLRHTRAQSPPP